MTKNGADARGMSNGGVKNAASSVFLHPLTEPPRDARSFTPNRYTRRRAL
jgi:hypothetical protein